MITSLMLLLCLVAGGGLHLFQVLTLLAWIGRWSRHEAAERGWRGRLAPLGEGFRVDRLGSPHPAEPVPVRADAPLDLGSADAVTASSGGFPAQAMASGTGGACSSTSPSFATR